MTHVFLDTEFTQFHDPELLALGLVSEDGRECYVEIADVTRQARASGFCQETVIPQFGLVDGAAAADDVAAGLHVAAWLHEVGGRLLVSHDYALDWHLLEDVLRAAGQWERLRLRLVPDNVAGIVEPGTPGEAAMIAAFDAARWPARHHALVDARALRAAWLATPPQA